MRIQNYNKMNVIYSSDPPLVEFDQKSIFLVGPTPRSELVPSWRPNAIEVLQAGGFNGKVLVPEPADGVKFPDYDNQVDWECAGLNNCKVIVAWVPRDMQTMLALTTNVEFGFWMGKEPNKVFYGRPTGAPHTRYLDWLYQKMTGRLPINNLNELLLTALDEINQSNE